DADGDGDLDLVVALGETFGVVGVFSNAGAGTFGPLQVVPVGGQEPGTVLAMDLDGDRVADLVTANEDSNDLSVLLGTGAGSFVAVATVLAGGNPNGLCGGDVDGDGDMDFATANRNSNSVTVIRNTTLAAATAPTMTVGGPVAVGQTTPVLLSSPQDAGMFYLSALSRFGSPGIALGDGRSLPVGPSDVLDFTLGSNPVWQNSFGLLGGSGHAHCRLALPNTPLLNGFTFYGTFVVFDGGRFLSIGSIADQVVIQVP
ncbi:MAG: VCBS repeat-containing protein, partial [Planctomycetes bacterium]|nr:VCBS repeat-containing protein [Planctomycetota bacterium]